MLSVPFVWAKTRVPVRQIKNERFTGTKTRVCFPKALCSLLSTIMEQCNDGHAGQESRGNFSTSSCTAGKYDGVSPGMSTTSAIITAEEKRGTLGRPPPGPVSRHVQIWAYYSFKNDSSLHVSPPGSLSESFLSSAKAPGAKSWKLCNMTREISWKQLSSDHSNLKCFNLAWWKLSLGQESGTIIIIKIRGRTKYFGICVGCALLWGVVRGPWRWGAVPPSSEFILLAAALTNGGLSETKWV